tara:strand:+ start:296 stop:481 length:186 start_codon:yes stop_codon:yes gene_type:complete
MLSRPKQKILIDNVMFKLFENDTELNYKKYIEKNNNQNNEKQEINLYEIILTLLFCKCNDE